jgi:hypothetical protein
MIRATFDGLSLRMTAPIMILVVLFVGTMLPIFGPLVAPGPWRNSANSVYSPSSATDA